MNGSVYMTKKQLLELAIEHIRAEIGGLQFVQLHRPNRPPDAIRRTNDIIFALYEAISVLELEVSGEK